MNTTANIIGNVVATQQHLATIEAKLFEVVKLPLAPIGMPSFFKAPKDAFGHYKSNGGECIGKVGKDSTAMQPKEFYDNILTTVHEFGADLDLNTLKFREWCGSSKIEFSIKMHPISFKNNKGLNDVTNMEVTFSTSYDGSKSNVISLYTERLVCTNGMVANKLQGALKGRNTIGGKAKILSYAKELAQIINGANEFKEKMEALDKITVSKAQIEAYKKSLFGYNTDSLLATEGNHTKKYNILERFEESLNIEFERTGQTAFGLLQGTTYYTNHIANNSKKATNEEYIRFGTGFKTNAKAQELLFALID
jgi:hypothetical protein